MPWLFFILRKWSFSFPPVTNIFSLTCLALLRHPAKSIDCKTFGLESFPDINSTKKERMPRVPEELWLACRVTWRTGGVDLSAVIHAKPRQNKLGIGATRRPAGVDVFAVTLSTMTGSFFSRTDRRNLWKWERGVHMDGNWSLSVPCSNQVKPSRAEFKANVPHKSPGFPVLLNEN